MSLTERCGEKTGRELQDKVFDYYHALVVESSDFVEPLQFAFLSRQVPECARSLATVPWYQSDGTRNIVRHPLNDRKQLSIKLRYKHGILQHGIMHGCRGDPWLLQFLA